MLTRGVLRCLVPEVTAKYGASGTTLPSTDGKGDHRILVEVQESNISLFQETVLRRRLPCKTRAPAVSCARADSGVVTGALKNASESGQSMSLSSMMTILERCYEDARVPVEVGRHRATIYPDTPLPRPMQSQRDGVTWSARTREGFQSEGVTQSTQKNLAVRESASHPSIRRQD